MAGLFFLFFPRKTWGVFNPREHRIQCIRDFLLIVIELLQIILLSDVDGGTDKYLGSTSIPFEKKPVLTINEALCRMKVALGGFASEILLFDGSTKMGGDDLTAAVSAVESMMQSQDFRNLAARLPVPTPGPLDNMIGDPTVRAVIDYHIGVCVQELTAFKPLMHTIAEKLCECEELTGEQVTQLFGSFVASTMR